MPQRVALVTYRDSKAYPLPSTADLPLLQALQARGIAAETQAWDDPRVDWLQYGAVVLRSTWNYHRRLPDFLDWLDTLTGRGVRLHNPAAVVHWNAHKSYMAALEQRGVSIVHTIFGEDGMSLRGIMDDYGWDEVVVKRPVGASGEGTDFVRRDIADRWRYLGGLMIQPLMAEVHDGELSIMFAQGRFTHAVIKRPGPDSHFVYEEYGGSNAAHTPSPLHLQTARQVLQVAAGICGVALHEMLYTRVDGIVVDDQFVLMELELIEPNLYHQHSDTAAADLAAAIENLI